MHINDVKDVIIKTDDYIDVLGSIGGLLNTIVINNENYESFKIHYYNSIELLNSKAEIRLTTANKILYKLNLQITLRDDEFRKCDRPNCLYQVVNLINPNNMLVSSHTVKTTIDVILRTLKTVIYTYECRAIESLVDKEAKIKFDNYKHALLNKIISNINIILSTPIETILKDK